MFGRQNVWSGKCLVGKMFGWQNVWSGLGREIAETFLINAFCELSCFCFVATSNLGKLNFL
jgi:hypothetical protein